MINYKKVYCNFFNYDYGYDNILCEVCNDDNKNVLAVDIHHIKPRGHSKCDNLNEIHNLIAICRPCHIKAENNKTYNKKLKIKNLKNIIKQLET